MKSLLSDLFSKNNSDKNSPSAFEKRVGFTFSDSELLNRAFAHSSLLDENREPYERLEFLGDAVLDLVVSEYLFHNFPTKEEGHLTKMRMKYVNSDYLYKVAEDLNIAEDCIVNKSVDMKKPATREKILSDILEAVIGAIYLENGMQRTQKFIKKWIINNNNVSTDDNITNYKGELIEYCQQNNIAELEFQITNVSGPDHNKEYTTTLYIQNEVYGKGIGGTKKAAEQEAAHQAIQKLDILSNIT